ncbi:hypothetical protein ElyMa_000084700 [Elysia marginata]|uniref:Uncharacterized protein n=1 Tax=Elysia marginata TaxID=1093978 RepID=A0AAV4EIM7_9GAST|nr:hypothetical protein ElyMa_000084700 [Elysia marginata]
MPFSTTHTNLIRIACGSCAGGPSTHDVPLGGALAAAVSGPGHALDTKTTTLMLNELKVKVKETHGATANLATEVYNRWTAVFGNDQATLQKLKRFITRHLTIRINEDSLTENQKNLVSVLLQTSNFALFLESQETQPAYGAKQSSLSEVKGRLLQVKCGARELLTLSDAEIQSIVTEHVQQSSLLRQLADASGGLKRAVCAVVLEMITTYLENIDLA